MANLLISRQRVEKGVNEIAFRDFGRHFEQLTEENFQLSAPSDRHLFHLRNKEKRERKENGKSAGALLLEAKVQNSESTGSGGKN